MNNPVEGQMVYNPVEGEEVKLPGAVFGKVEKIEGYPQYAVAQLMLRVEKRGPKYPTGRALVFKDGKYRADVSERYRLFPTEQAVSIADDVAKQIGFKQFEYKESKGGNVINVTYLANGAVSDLPHTWVEPKGGDVINLGYSIRNSIDGTGSFGADLFSFRKVCSNGAIVGVKKLNKAPLKRHTGKMNEFTDELALKLKVFLLDNLEPFAAFYKALPTIELNLEIAKAISTVIPTRYLPPFIEKERKTHNVKLTQNVDLYTTYNTITDLLWHNPGKVEPRSASVYMTNLHKKVLEPLVAKVVA